MKCKFSTKDLVILIIRLKENVTLTQLCYALDGSKIEIFDFDKKIGETGLSSQTTKNNTNITMDVIKLPIGSHVLQLRPSYQNKAENATVSHFAQVRIVSGTTPAHTRLDKKHKNHESNISSGSKVSSAIVKQKETNPKKSSSGKKLKKQRVKHSLKKRKESGDDDDDDDDEDKDDSDDYDYDDDEDEEDDFDFDDEDEDYDEEFDHSDYDHDTKEPDHKHSKWWTWDQKHGWKSGKKAYKNFYLVSTVKEYVTSILKPTLPPVERFVTIAPTATRIKLSTKIISVGTDTTTIAAGTSTQTIKEGATTATQTVRQGTATQTIAAGTETQFIAAGTKTQTIAAGTQTIAAGTATVTEDVLVPGVTVSVDRVSTETETQYSKSTIIGTTYNLVVSTATFTAFDQTLTVNGATETVANTVTIDGPPVTYIADTDTVTRTVPGPTREITKYILQQTEKKTTVFATATQLVTVNLTSVSKITETVVGLSTTTENVVVTAIRSRISTVTIAPSSSFTDDGLSFSSSTTSTDI